VKAAKVTIALVSRKSVEARWVNFEAGVAIGAHDDMPVIPVVFRGLKLDQIGHPLSPKLGRSLGTPTAIRALLNDLATLTGAAQQMTVSDEELEEFAIEVKVVERRLPETRISLVPQAHRTSHRIVEVRFDLFNGGNASVTPAQVEIDFPHTWLSSGNRPAIGSDVLEVQDRNVSPNIIYRRIAYKRTARQPNHGSFTPLPGRVAPKQPIRLEHLYMQILEKPEEGRELQCHYRIYCDDIDVVEGHFLLEDLLKGMGANVG
jgi:hypothetical protein